ncbi:PREDICTED: pyrroline-5-carboxylate reductase 1, mitochondrial [Vollenhovia emeryi]|uniref:pyrroline-5-carboxylate reductase 1, mitochondrial n=1 Tax=Vollenhovia emeryi TaxID=411798 RepID=UPI0005F39A38|nr:PREDICTED: pyrroline-5-carboxylate reductase 1, mitochondrial [Vollenhovia emeryi]XP_011878602.1 PREDICTED: pyrroline-5-carboxylate reductase 1, mitochondrial [Vollenhovia emeryi]XP_011878603.1 PREDICTED: pyrroline-5-carboxylate reductase 1, mitochondrial [Vollenhovia emeryi]
MTEQYLKSIKVGFIGGGNMASAIGAGLIRKGVLKPDNVWVSGRTDRTHGFWRDLGVHPTLENNEVVCNCDIVFLTVKPHMLDDALATVGRRADEKFESKLFVSVLAGVSLDVLYFKLLAIVTSPRIIRSMPNTPMMVGEGITVYCGRNAKPNDLELVDRLFSYIGMSHKVPESLMNCIGGLSGCGPAFAYLVIEGLADGAVKMGVPRPMATKFAAQVLVGAGKMVLETGQHPGQLKDEVCSPGGTTINGIHVMEVGGVRGSMMNAVEAAVNKTNELTSRIK